MTIALSLTFLFVDTLEHATVLKERHDEWQETDKDVFQRAGLLHGYACKLLYRELKGELL